MDWLISAAGPDGGIRRPGARRRAPQRHAAQPSSVGPALDQVATGRGLTWRPAVAREPVAVAAGLDERTPEAGAGARRRGRRAAAAVSGPGDRSWRGSEVPSPRWSVSPCCPPSCRSNAACRRSSAPARRPRPWSTSIRDATAPPASRWRSSRPGRRTRPSRDPVRGSRRRDPRPGRPRQRRSRPRRSGRRPDPGAARRPRQRRAGATSSTTASSSMSVATCPFASGVADTPSLCHVTAGLAGQIGARVHGHSTVVLDETMALGDAGCHLQVRLEPAVRGQARADPPVARRGDGADRPGAPPRPVPEPAAGERQRAGRRRLAAQALRAFGVEDEDIDDVQLAITEACANVVEHATDADTYEVKVELAVRPVRDHRGRQGEGFDATTLPEPAAGRGVRAWPGADAGAGGQRRLPERAAGRCGGAHGEDAALRAGPPAVARGRRSPATEAAQVRPSCSWASRSAECSPIQVAGSTSNPARRAASSTRGSSSTSTATVRVSASASSRSTFQTLEGR